MGESAQLNGTQVGLFTVELDCNISAETLVAGVVDEAVGPLAEEVSQVIALGREPGVYSITRRYSRHRLGRVLADVVLLHKIVPEGKGRGVGSRTAIGRLQQIGKSQKTPTEERLS